MNTIQRIAKNTVALLVAQFVTAISGLVLSIFIARNLGDAIFGKYSFALAFVAIFAVFSDLGYNTLIIREVARDRSKASKYLNNVLCMRVILSLVIFALIVMTVNLMSYTADTKNVVYLFGIYTLLTSISDVFKVTFRAFEKMEYETIIIISVNIIRLSLVLFVLFLGYGLIGLAHIFVLSGALDVLLSILVCRKEFVRPRIEFDFKFWTSTIMMAIPFSIVTLFSLIYIRIDTLMLSMMKGDEVVGWYNAAYGLILAFKPIPQLFMNALFPLMSSYFKSSKESLYEIYEVSLKYLFILGLPLTAGITLLADKFIYLFYGQQFENSIVALQILALDILIFFLFQPLVFIALAINKERQRAVLAGAGALLNVILNLYLIPNYSYVGAAIATIITETTLIALYFAIISESFYRIEICKLFIKPLIATLVMSIFIYYAINRFGLILTICLAVGLYFLVLVITKCITNREIQIFEKVITKKV